MENKPLVTIGIPAYNEEANIKKLLHSLLHQEQLHYELKEIIVVSDASTDNTESEILSLNSPYIRLIVNEERLGQPMSHNKILNLAQGEIIVFIEADTLPCTTLTVDEVVKPFTESIAKLGMVVGDSVPILAKTVTEQIVTYVQKIKRNTYEEWKKGHNVFIANGQPIKAISKKFALKLFWPKDSLEDVYLYLRLRELSLRMVRRKKAAVFMRNASTFKDYVNERGNIRAGLEKIKKYFSPDLISRELKYPRYLLLRYYLRSIFEKPLLMIGYYFLEVATRFAIRGKKEFTPLYDPNDSTKKTFQNLMIHIYQYSSFSCFIYTTFLL